MPGRRSASPARPPFVNPLCTNVPPAMTGIYARKFNWLPRPSAWQQSQAWREKRQAMIQDFQSKTDAFSSGFGAAMSNQISGQAQLTTQIVMSRLQAQAKAKSDQFAALSSVVNQLA